MIKRFFAWLFKRRFVHPIVDESIDTAIIDHINKGRKKQIAEVEKYQKELNNYLHTYFSHQYSCTEDMVTAFSVTNKKWQSLVREVNSTNKLINLDKKAFEKKVKSVLDEVAKKQK